MGEIVKIQHLLDFFPRTIGPISTKLGTKHHLVEEIQVVQVHLSQFHLSFDTVTCSPMWKNVYMIVNPIHVLFFQDLKIYMLSLQTPCLTFLDARNCDLNERVIPIIGRSLRMGCFLTTLHIENTLISGRAMVILGK